MATSPDQFAAEKGDKALALREQGLSRGEIAERLGIRPANVGGMLQRAKQRRERFNEEKANGKEG